MKTKTIKKVNEISAKVHKLRAKRAERKEKIRAILNNR